MPVLLRLDQYTRVQNRYAQLIVGNPHLVSRDDTGTDAGSTYCEAEIDLRGHAILRENLRQRIPLPHECRIIVKWLMMVITRNPYGLHQTTLLL